MKLLMGMAALTFGAFLGKWFWAPAGGEVPIELWSTGPTVKHVESLGELVAIKVQLSDVLVARDGGYRGSWLIKGDALLSIDVASAQVVDKDLNDRTATICLPQPFVRSPRVDFERTKTWDVQDVSWVPWRGDEDAMRDKAMRHAQRLIEHAAGSEEHLDQARASAARVIERVYRMIDWDVSVEWEQQTDKSWPSSPDGVGSTP